MYPFWYKFDYSTDGPASKVDSQTSHDWSRTSMFKSYFKQRLI